MEQTLIQESPKNQRVQDKYVRKIKGVYIHICAKIKIEYEWKKFRLERGGKKVTQFHQTSSHIYWNIYL